MPCRPVPEDLREDEKPRAVTATPAIRRREEPDGVVRLAREEKAQEPRRTQAAGGARQMRDRNVGE